MQHQFIWLHNRVILIPSLWEGGVGVIKKNKLILRENNDTYFARNKQKLFVKIRASALNLRSTCAVRAIIKPRDKILPQNFAMLCSLYDTNAL